ncbi:MAG: superfamily [Bacteroidota bacterium]|jgi:hypothetical protein
MEYLKFNSVVNGTPDVETFSLIQKDSFLDILIEDSVSGFSFPENSSEAFKEELNQVVKEVKGTMLDSDEVKAYKSYNVSVPMHIKSYINSVKGPKTAIDLVEELNFDLLPFIMKLKYRFNRPRPFQLAPYYKVFLTPLVMTKPLPSYPSMSAIQGIVMCSVLGNRYPPIYRVMNDLSDSICESRVRLGVNFQSDITGAKIISNLILSNTEFKVKYAL